MTSSRHYVAILVIWLQFAASYSWLIRGGSYSQQLKFVCPLKACSGPVKGAFQCNSAGCTRVPMDLLDNGVERVLMQNNRITVIPNMEKLTELTTLDLARNRITNVSTHVFRMNEKLELLDLSYNKIRELERMDHLDSIKKILLRNNELRVLDQDLFAFPQLLNLEVLDLSYNNLERISFTAFNDLRLLQDLHLRSNNLTFIDPKHCMGLDNLRTLDVARNRLMKVDEGNFEPLVALETLDLSYNDISQINPEGFKGLTELRILHLEGNVLTALGKEMLALTSLQTLYISNNPISHLLPGHFPPSLIRFHMQYMTRMHTVGPDVLTHLPHLQVIDISSNHILGSIHPRAFGGGNSTVTTLILSHNRLETVDRNLVNWRHLRHLDLSSNPWRCDCHLEFLKEIAMPPDNGDDPRKDIRCSSPASLNMKSMHDLQYSDFPRCGVFTRSRMIIGLVVIVLVVVVAVVTVVLYRCRHTICACGYKTTRQYSALYNKSQDQDDLTMRDELENITNVTAVRLHEHGEKMYNTDSNRLPPPAAV